MQEWSTGEVASGNFSVVLTGTPGSNGATRQDNILSFGYNPQGSKAGEHQWFENIENTYKTGAGIIQLEYYWQYVNAAGTNNYRPFSITTDLTSDASDAAMRTNTFEVGYVDTTNDWLQFQSTSSSGTLALSRNSTIAYTGSNTNWITQAGTPLIGYASSVGHLFDGLSSVNFYTSASAGTAFDVKFNASGSTSLKWDGTNGWQFSTSSSTWQKMGSVAAIYTTGTAVCIGPVSCSAPGTLEVYDATATTGNTNLTIRAGAGQAATLISALASNGSTTLFKVDGSGVAWTSYFRDLADAFALQTGFDSTHVLLLGSGRDIAWSSTSTFPGTIDLGFHRNAAGVLEINNGSSGTYRDLKLRNVVITGQPSSSGTRYLCVDTTGAVTSSASACSGT